MTPEVAGSNPARATDEDDATILPGLLHLLRRPSPFDRPSATDPDRAARPREVHDHTTGFCDLPPSPTDTHDSHSLSPTRCFWSSSLGRSV